MQIEKGKRNIFQVTLTGHELASLISSARWIAEDRMGELTTEAISNLKQLLINYDKATKRLYDNSSS